MIVILLLFMLANSLKIALLWEKQISQSWILADKQLSEFLFQHLQTNFKVQSFAQKFIGDLLEVQEFQPDVVVDFAESSLFVFTNANFLALTTLYLYTKENHFRPHPLAKLLRETKTDRLELVKNIANSFGLSEAVLVNQGLIDLNESFELNIEELQLKPGLTQDDYDTFVLREVRVKGIHAIFIVADEAINNALMTSFAKFEMEESYAFFMIGNNCQFDISLFPTGLCALL